MTEGIHVVGNIHINIETVAEKLFCRFRLMIQISTKWKIFLLLVYSILYFLVLAVFFLCFV